ncbi:MAG: leucyl/phenylalanyl-tRNA--protein transferase, partial [Austwickia sp.]|nr:leucyl/phenylalanyl-tRNA--protein transferase [Austwickia sp.]
MPARPVEPPPSGWDLGAALTRPGLGDVVALGADLQPGTILRAYRHGIFPMGLEGVRGMGWWSPVRRGVLEPGTLHVSRSLRRSCRRYRVSVDRAFADVVTGCATARTEGNWITGPIEAAYGQLHRLGWTHSVEVWDEQGRLTGGLYGLALGGLFAGESM